MTRKKLGSVTTENYMSGWVIGRRWRVWEYDNGSWSKVAEEELIAVECKHIETVQSFSVYHGKLYAGLGNTANADGQIWSYGNKDFCSLRQSAKILTGILGGNI